MWVSYQNEFYWSMSETMNGKYKDYKVQYFPFLAGKEKDTEIIHFYGYSVARKFVNLTPEEKQKLSIFNLLKKIQLN